MNRDEARLILSTRPLGASDPSDVPFLDALQIAATDSELAKWWAEEQAWDQIIAAKLQGTRVPVDLKSRLLHAHPPGFAQRSIWQRRLVLAAAAVLILAALFSSWRGPFQPAVSLADYRSEMVSFIKLDPPLELESHRLPAVMEWLRKSPAPSQVNVSQKLQQLEPLGCRTLAFRGHPVALICFRRERDKLVHLFVVDQNAFPHLRDRSSPEFAAEGEWMTASWTENGQTYLMTTKGDRQLLEKYLPTS